MTENMSEASSQECALLVKVSLQTWHCILSAILVFQRVFSSCTAGWFGDLNWNLCSFPTLMLRTSSSVWFLSFHCTIRGREERANGHQKFSWLPTSVFPVQLHLLNNHSHFAPVIWIFFTRYEFLYVLVYLVHTIWLNHFKFLCRYRW